MITSILKRMQGKRPHLAVLVVLLGIAFVLTNVLGYQAHVASRNQTRMAVGTLREHAAMAGIQWKEYLQGYLFTSLIGMFSPLVSSVNREGTAAFDHISDNVVLAALCDCFDPSIIQYYFAYDFAKDSIQTRGRIEPDDSVYEWIKTGLTANPAFSAPDGSWAVGVLVGSPDGVQHQIAYALHLTTGSASRPVAAYGFEADTVMLAYYMNRVWRNGRLLAALTRNDVPNDWVLSLSVAGPDGHVVYESPGRYPATYSSRDSLQSMLAGLTYEVSVRPDAAADLVIGGMPQSRLPLLLGLSVLTAALLVVSVFLIRREAEITRLRSDFIAGVSHELRTPLAQIRMFAETLTLGRVRSEGERHRSLQIIDQEARRLTHLVENVLLFARSERNRSRINPELTDLGADVREAVHGFAILCHSNEVEIRPELQDAVMAPVDRGALRQILLNLLDNAIKYGPLRQRVTVGMALFHEHVRIWVDDEGPGVPSQERARAFDSFYRLSRDVDSPVAGSGIGLAVVRELVGLHGGRAWIDEAPGGGARVVAEFPGAYLRADATGGWAVA